MALNFLNDGYFAGKVGIGTDSPTQGKVDILDAGAYSAHTGHGLTINSNANNAYTSMYMGADDSIDAIYIQSAGRNTSFTSKKLLLNPNGGNVGIGVDDPDAKLEIKGTGAVSGLTFKTTDSSSNETFFIQDGGRTGVRYYPFTIGQASGTSPATGARFQVSTTANDFVVLNDSSTGIGTITPQSKLQVAGGIQIDRKSVV